MIKWSQSSTKELYREAETIMQTDTRVLDGQTKERRRYKDRPAEIEHLNHLPLTYFLKVSFFYYYTFFPPFQRASCFLLDMSF